MDTILKLAIIILVGLIGGRLARRFNLPSVSGYIVAGLLIGPSFLNIIKAGETTHFSIINEVALAAIAFSVGSEFLYCDIKKSAKKVFIITLCEVMGALLVVFLVMYYICLQPFGFSLVIASMSAATAPAGILMVIRELKADGPLVRTILPVVAIDDALGIIAFGISLSVANLMSGTAQVNLVSIIAIPLLQIVCAIVLGVVLGIFFAYFAVRAYSKNELLKITLMAILLAAGLANLFNISALLTLMAMGAMLINIMRRADRVFNIINDYTPPIYLLFFTLAGASLNLSVLSSVGLLGVAYIFARAFGKVAGAAIGAKVVKAPKQVQQNIGMSLLTQGGISIGLSMIVAKELPEYSTSIITVILFSVLIYEILGPILAKFAIQRAGEKNGLLKEN